MVHEAMPQKERAALNEWTPALALLRLSRTKRELSSWITLLMPKAHTIVCTTAEAENTDPYRVLATTAAEHTHMLSTTSTSSSSTSSSSSSSPSPPTSSKRCALNWPSQWQAEHSSEQQARLPPSQHILRQLRHCCCCWCCLFVFEVTQKLTSKGTTTSSSSTVSQQSITDCAN